VRTSAAYIVTTSALGSSKTQLWESHRPLTLGHPFQWMIEKTTKGIRVRDLSLTRKGIQPKGAQELSEDALLNGAELQIPVKGDKTLTLKIRPVVEKTPAFAQGSAGTLRLYECTGDWVRQSFTLTADHQATAHGIPAFRISASAGSLKLEPQADGLKISVKRQPARAWNKGDALSFSAQEAAEVEIYKDTNVWRFGQASAPEFVDSPAGEDSHDPAWILFKKSARATALAMATFLAMSWFWPKPKEDPKELVPPQFAKIVMAQPKAKPASAGSADAAGGINNDVQKDVASKTANAPAKVQNAAVVQAFRAKALSHAVSGLLKGGMTTLLAQSDFVSGAAASANARSVFDSKSSAMQATAPNAGSDGIAGKNVAVAGLGGAGAGGVAGGVGYGKGDKAGIKGQGGAFVSMDVGNAAVDEGLTKDEVGEVIHRHMSEVRYCYESAMLRTPDIEGKLMTSFVIGGNGMVKSTEVKSSTLSDPRLDDCILRRLVTWKFPNPRGGVDVAVSYPFIFKSLGR